MSKNISPEEIKKFWPKDAPNIDNVQKYVLKYKKEKGFIYYLFFNYNSLTLTPNCISVILFDITAYKV